MMLPSTIPQYYVGHYPVNEVDQNLASRDTLLQQLKDSFLAASDCMKQMADSKQRDIQLQRDLVLFLSYNHIHNRWFLWEHTRTD